MKKILGFVAIGMIVIMVVILGLLIALGGIYNGIGAYKEISEALESAYWEKHLIDATFYSVLSILLVLGGTLIASLPWLLTVGSKETQQPENENKYFKPKAIEP